MHSSKIIYAAYGSNMLKERFILYIYGGIFNNKSYKGCNDKTDPISLGYIYIPHRLYFAKNSSSWDNGGVAFLSRKEEKIFNNYSIVRLWEINEEQFYDIWIQEGKHSFYPYLLKLGEIKGIEILTFTGDWENEINEPSESYIEIIKKGIKETTGWNKIQINSYIKKVLNDL